MKMRCTYRSVLRGDIVKVGQVLNLTEAECELDVVKRFFVPVDATTPGANASGVTSSKQIIVAGLTREEAIMKLQQAGQRVSERISDAKLAERYEDVFAAQ